MRPLLFLDFDGVIADSIPECFVVSWLAYNHLIVKKNPSFVALADYRLFRSFRPYIRIGSDYMFIQKALDSGKTLASQEAFDHYLSLYSDEEHQLFYQVFYQAREEMLQNHADFWFSLNPLFPHVRDFLEKAAHLPELFILSTKKSWFIEKILEYNGIFMESSRIIDSGKEIKATIIESIMKKSSASIALFIDDQIDHFHYISHDSIRAYLPTWGYIEPAWLEKRDFPSLSVEQAKLLFQGFLGP
ncbi:MAG: HAD family hydrolase [Spirochaetales bacterium]|nr:HAD family hydrolase [Spirochaetales bacterium]